MSVISGPPPTQQPPASEHKEVKLTPLRKRPSQAPAALFMKGVFRPILKVLYFTLREIRNRPWLTVGVVALLLVSIFATTYFTTGQLPFGIGNDPFDFHVHGTNGGGDKIKNWLYALRDGDATTLSLLDANMSQPTDPNQLVTAFSQKAGHQWKTINVLSASSESDTSVDSFVEVDFSDTGPNGGTNGIVLFHFVTINQGQEFLLSAKIVDVRVPLK